MGLNKEIENQIEKAADEFKAMLREQYERNERMAGEAVDGSTGSRADDTDVKPQSEKGGRTVIGLAPGDGIGPVIMEETRLILEELLADEIASGRIEFKEIEGFTIENRLEKGKTVPREVLSQMEECDVMLKGPTTTPNAAMGGNNLESANVFLRKHFDLFANVRPVSLPDKGIDWTFFRENTEGEYALGSRGIRLGSEAGDGLSVDFKVTTSGGSRRIAKAAYEFARANGKKRVSIVTKANIMKKTDGDFQSICLEVAKDYPEIETDTWFVDIMAANLINEDIRSGFEVFVLPNLYGDIITDEAAQIQGGVGTAGSANIGSRMAMFEAIHGSAPRMVEDGIAHLANPASLLTATVMMLRHIGLTEQAARLERAVSSADVMLGPKMTGLPGGASCIEFAEEVRANLR